LAPAKALTLLANISAVPFLCPIHSVPLFKDNNQLFLFSFLSSSSMSRSSSSSSRR
jgi:hypothetical protein